LDEVDHAFQLEHAEHYTCALDFVGDHGTVIEILLIWNGETRYVLHFWDTHYVSLPMYWQGAQFTRRSLREALSAGQSVSAYYRDKLTDERLLNSPQQYQLYTLDHLTPQGFFIAWYGRRLTLEQYTNRYR
jgi:hypothetical protein